MNLTARADAVAAFRAHYMPELLKVEDFEAFESIVASNGKSLLAGVMAACLAGFDESLRGSMPRGWPAHHRARRKLATLVGPVEFERTVFVDELGRRRALLDELLSIPPRSRLSPGAFLWLVGRAAEESYRKTASFELKLAALYVGKKEVAPGRYERGGLRLTCADLPPRGFWDEVWAMLSAEYDPDDVGTLWVGADGGKWCGPGRIAEMAPEPCRVRGSLDPLHVMQKVCRAFPEGPRREWAAGPARRGRPLQLARMCGRVLPKTEGAKRRDRVRDLRGCMPNNADCVVFPRESMGTMEGTNAYVGAARMKGRGMPWSRKGAEAMRLVRCAIAEGRPLVVPKFPALCSKREERAAEKFLAKSLSRGPESCGSGWAPPHQASTWAMRSSACFRAGSC